MRDNSYSAMQRMPSLLKPRHRLLHLWRSLERINPADIFTDGNCEICQSRTMSSRRCDLMAIVMVKLKHRRSTSAPIILKRDVSKRVLKEFTIASKTIPFFENLNSALVGLKKSASRWTRTRRKISPIEWRQMSTFGTKTIGGSLSISLKNRTDERPFWLQRSIEQITPSSPRVWRRTIRTDSLLAIPGMAFRRLLHPAHLGGSGTIHGAAHDN